MNCRVSPQLGSFRAVSLLSRPRLPGDASAALPTGGKQEGAIMTYDTRFGEFLATVVRRQGLSMADFAARVALSPSTLSRVRTGQRLPAAEQVARWADELKLDTEARTTFI